MKEVWLVYEMARGTDRIRSAHATAESADKEVDRLLKLHPNADGYYSESLEVKE